MHGIKLEGNLFLPYTYTYSQSPVFPHYVIIGHDSKWHLPPVFESHPRSC